MAFHDVRGALVSAVATLTTGTAGTLINGDADYFLDIVEITMANNSTVAAAVDLKNDGTTVRSISVPANGTVQLTFDAPLRQETKNIPWVLDMEDITGTSVTVGATLIKQLNN